MRNERISQGGGEKKENRLETSEKNTVQQDIFATLKMLTRLAPILTQMLSQSSSNKRILVTPLNYLLLLILTTMTRVTFHKRHLSGKCKTGM